MANNQKKKEEDATCILRSATEGWRKARVTCPVVSSREILNDGTRCARKHTAVLLRLGKSKKEEEEETELIDGESHYSENEKQKWIYIRNIHHGSPSSSFVLSRWPYCTMHGDPIPKTCSNLTVRVTCFRTMIAVFRCFLFFSSFGLVHATDIKTKTKTKTTLSSI